VAHFACSDERECLDEVRRLLSYLPGNNMDDPPVEDTGDPITRRLDDILTVVPGAADMQYDVRDVIERIVDMAADHLKMDPAEIRRINMIPPSAMPFQTGLSFNYDCGEFEKVMDQALEMADYKNFEKRRAEAKKRGKLRGIGVANYIESTSGAPNEGAEVQFEAGGKVMISTGTESNGQGHETSFTQIASDRFGLPMEAFRFVQADTRYVKAG